MRVIKALAGLAVAGCTLAFAGQTLAAEPIRVGSFLSVTGPASFLGEPEKKTLELYVEKLNKQGGVLGRKIELTVYDDGGAADKAASFAKRLVDSDKVDILIGGSTTGTSLAASKIAEMGEIPFISLAGGIEIVDPVKKWVFKTPHTDRMAAEKVFADMKKRGITKVAMISEDAGFGKSGRDQSLKVAPEYGIEIVADETYNAKDPDVTAQLTKIKNTAGVQAVFNFGFGQGPAVVTKNYRQLGITQPLYQSHGVASQAFVKLAGDAAEGIRMPATALAVSTQLPDADPQKPVVAGFLSDYKAAHGAEPSTFAGYAYDALQIALAAINRAGSTDKAKVRAALEGTSGYVGTTGLVSMSATDHMGLNLGAFRMVEVKKGDLILSE